MCIYRLSCVQLPHEASSLLTTCIGLCHELRAAEYPILPTLSVVRRLAQFAQKRHKTGSVSAPPPLGRHLPSLSLLLGQGGGVEEHLMLLHLLDSALAQLPGGKDRPDLCWFHLASVGLYVISVDFT